MSLKRRLLSGIGANIIAQGTSTLSQIAAIPLYLHFWTLTEYGTWLMLSAVPTYLALFDGGLLTAAGNTATRAMAAGDKATATEVLHTATAAIAMLGLTLAICVVPLTLGLNIDWLTNNRTCILALSASALISQFAILPDIMFRMTGKYGLGTNIQTATRLAEFAAQLAGAANLHTFEAAAFYGATTKLICFLITLSIASKICLPVKFGIKKANTNRLRTLISPALHYFAFPIAGALSFQGTTLALGSISGPASVVVFTSYRTIARLMVQAIGIISNALTTEFTLAVKSDGDTSLLVSLYRKAQIAATLLIIAISIGLYFSFQLLLEQWSGTQVEYSKSIMVAALIYAIGSAIALVPRNLLIAMGEHANIARNTLLAAAITLVIGYPLALQWGVSGMMWACAAIEIALATLSAFSALVYLRKIKTR